MKPLYIVKTNSSVRITLDGQAIKLSEYAKADVRFPLKRLNKIICQGNVDFNTYALLKCLDNDISVFFLNSKGELRASCYGAYEVEKSFSRVISEFLELSDWQDRLKLWKHSYYRRILLALNRKIFNNLPSYKIRDIENYLQNLITTPESSKEYLQGLLSCYICDYLKKLGVPEVYVSSRNSRFSIEKTFSYIFRPFIYAILLDLSLYKKNNPLKFAEFEKRIIVRRFEANEPLLLKLFAKNYNAFDLFLRELSNDPIR